MLPISVSDVSLFLTHTVPAFFNGDGVFSPATDADNYVTLLLRWLHFLAGIIWIGHLYFFNLVNGNLMKALDGPTKGKVIPQLMPRALWWFRWGALVTVLVGLMYYAMYILKPNYTNASSVSPGHTPRNTGLTFIVWLVVVVVFFAIEMVVMQKVTKDGRVLGVIVGVLVSIMAIVIIIWLNNSFTITVGNQSASIVSNNTYSIGIGGALGVVMLCNVWGIIWPYQKRIISWTADNAETGAAIPAESARLARIAFLASRTNTWLSVPMLFFMAASAHNPLFKAVSGG